MSLSELDQTILDTLREKDLYTQFARFCHATHKEPNFLPLMQSLHRKGSIPITVRDNNFSCSYNSVLYYLYFSHKDSAYRIAFTRDTQEYPSIHVYSPAGKQHPHDPETILKHMLYESTKDPTAFDDFRDLIMAFMASEL